MNAPIFRCKKSNTMILTVDQPSADRIDAWLASRLPDLSRSRIQELIREQFILCNDKPAKPRDAVKLGDRISIAIPEAVPAEAAAQDIPAGALRRPGHHCHRQRARHGCAPRRRQSRWHAGQRAASPLPGAAIRHRRRGAPGHRPSARQGHLRLPDCGENDAAHQHLVAQFSGRTNEKIYLCVTQNVPTPAAETVFTHIGRDSRNRQKMAVVTPPAGRASITDYKVLYGDAATRTALVLCHLHTGRTHQIRVHMKHKGTP